MFFCWASSVCLLALAWFPWCLLGADLFSISPLAHSRAEPHHIRYHEYFRPELKLLKGSTLDQEAHLLITVNAYNKTLFISLAPDKDILHPTYASENKDYLVYSGYVYDKNMSSLPGLADSALSNELGAASIVARKAEDGLLIDGVLMLDGTSYTIVSILDSNSHKLPPLPSPRLRRRQDRDATSIIYRDNDVDHFISKEDGCSTANTVVKRPSRLTQFSKLVRRDTTCNLDVKSVYIAVAGDCSYAENYSSVNEAKIAFIIDWLKVHHIYRETFGALLGIQEIYIPHHSCLTTPYEKIAWNRACDPDYKLKTRLNDFAIWAHQSPLSTSLWHLRTKCGTDGNIGLAHKPQHCHATHTIGGVKGSRAVGLSAITPESWKVIAHEIGHNFNATHDCDAENNTESSKCCHCHDCHGDYLMTSKSNAKTGRFSECSKTQICEGIQNLAKCFPLVESRSPIAEGECGNGIVEKDEDCDCGGDEECKKCCNDKCKFIGAAKCVDGVDKCCQSCQPKPAGTVCRPSRGECDVEETCDGVQGTCPKDNFQPNGKPCGNDNACGEGQCTSRDQQCHAYSGFHYTKFIDKYCSMSKDPCKISCATSTGKCMHFPGSFVDGTKCGRNLHCKGGVCEGAWMDKEVDWITQNLAATILILVGAGLFLIVIIYCSIIKYCQKAPISDIAPFPDAPPIHASSQDFPVLRPRPSLRNSPNQYRPNSRTPLIDQEDEA